MRIRHLSVALVFAVLVAGDATAQQTGAPPAPNGAATAAPAVRTARPQNPAIVLFNNSCSSCHGTTLAGARGPSLFTDSFLSKNSDDAILHTVQNGIADGGMPAFKDQFSEEQIRQVIAYLRIQGGRLKDHPPFVPDPNGQVIKSQKQTFKIEVVAAGLDTPWGEAFLPDGRMLVTERSGPLRIIDHGKLLAQPVAGTPKVFVRQDGGMLDVAVHDGWVYLSYTEVKPGVTPAPNSETAPNPAPPTMTVLVRGHIQGNAWVDNQVIFRAPPDLYTTTSDHYGSRFAFDKEGHMFYSLGERHHMQNAQDLTVPLGKIHRVNPDGTPLADNPFVNTPGADPTIWSYGHRNPEGLAFDPVTGNLWESEHGPTGGDEINIIRKGHNYGWGVVSMGLEPGITHQHQAGMDDPIAYYTPTIAPSGMSFYSGDRYPGWKNNLFVAALAGQELLRLEISGEKIVSQEAVFKEYGRVRDVITGPDGLLYVLLQNPTGSGTGLALSAATAGMVIRLVPVQ
jgi:glucose/arabinose dehydrogenase